MANHLLTTTELNNDTLAITNGASFYSNEFQIYSQWLRSTGCRPNEPLMLDKWAILDGSHVTLEPQKGNNQRIIALSNATIRDSIQTQKPILYAQNYRKYWHILRRFSLYPFAYLGGKEVGEYRYRYAFARNQKDAGLTDNQIRIAMGEVTQAAANAYIYSQVWSGG